MFINNLYAQIGSVTVSGLCCLQIYFEQIANNWLIVNDHYICSMGMINLDTQPQAHIILHIYFHFRNGRLLFPKHLCPPYTPNSPNL